MSKVTTTVREHDAKQERFEVVEVSVAELLYEVCFRSLSTIPATRAR